MSYFLKGENTEYIDEASRMLLTPYDSRETAALVFESGLFDRHGREQVMLTYLLNASSFGRGMPWLSNHVKFFISGVLGEHYEVIEEVENNRARVISPDPGFWVSEYIFRIQTIMEKQTEISGYEYCFSYFVSMLPFVTDEGDRSFCDIEGLFSSVESALLNEDCTDDIAKFARQIKDREKHIRDVWSQTT